MTSRPQLEIGKEYVAEIGAIAHGGHCVTYVNGCVVFVRGALTGEQASILITHKRQKVFFGVAQEILKKSEFRVLPSCEASRSCGGCDFQFIDLGHQRALKTLVLKESLQRFAQLDELSIEKIIGVGVRSIGGPTGLGWRTRARFEWKDAWQMHAYRSERMVGTPACTTVTKEIGAELTRLQQAGGLSRGEYTFAQGMGGVSVVGPPGNIAGPSVVSRNFAGIDWETSPHDFWQSHAALLPEVQEAISDSGALRVGANWWDLYAGAGVFSHVLAEGVGVTGLVTSVEGNRAASVAARNRFAELTGHPRADVRVVNSSVESFVNHMRGSVAAPDGVFLDPPRSGAGIPVCETLLEIAPRWILYLACDPVALARDTRALCSGGVYELAYITAWDAFPMTHHFESLAVFRSAKVS